MHNLNPPTKLTLSQRVKKPMKKIFTSSKILSSAIAQNPSFCSITCANVIHPLKIIHFLSLFKAVYAVLTPLTHKSPHSAERNRNRVKRTSLSSKNPRSQRHLHFLSGRASNLRAWGNEFEIYVGY